MGWWNISSAECVLVRCQLRQTPVQYEAPDFTTLKRCERRPDLLAAFDLHRDRFCQAAGKVCTRHRRGSGTLVAADIASSRTPGANAAFRGPTMPTSHRSVRGSRQLPGARHEQRPETRQSRIDEAQAEQAEGRRQHHCHQYLRSYSLGIGMRLLGLANSSLFNRVCLISSTTTPAPQSGARRWRRSSHRL